MSDARTGGASLLVRVFDEKAREWRLCRPFRKAGACDGDEKGGSRGR
jgi:hypothetical protein